MAMEAQKYRNEGHEVYWNKMLDCILNSYCGEYKLITEPEGLPFLSLPHPDRVFTRAKEYTSGNYKYLPGTHIMSASGCWWGKCSFCVENRGNVGKETVVSSQKDGEKCNASVRLAIPSYEVRSPDDIRKELFECGWQGYKEVFDDAATFNSEDRHWWFEVCNAVSAVHKQFGMRFSCNYRIGEEHFEWLKLSGFRMLLFGVESANQATLDKINKGVKVEDIIPTIRKASEAGLEPHIAGMVGYPWESEEDCLRTVKLFRYLLKRGYAKTAQMSFYCPPINQEQGNKQHLKYLKGIYYVAFNPLFWYNKIIEIKTMADLNYLIRCIKEGYRGIWAKRN